MTVTGCVQREVDVLRTSPGNLGLSDEYVLIRSSVKSTSPSSAGRPATTGTTRGSTEDAAATSGPSGRVYRVTGDKERQLEGQLGRQIEITASFDSDADASLEARGDTMSPKPAGTPDRRPTAHDVPEIVIHSVRPLGIACAGTVER
jgi:hypothetical protein